MLVHSHRRYQQAIQASAKQNNMPFRKFEWYVFGQNFSQDCRNNTKVSSFVIGRLRHLFRSWPFKITCFCRRFESKVFRHKFSQDCINIIKGCLFTKDCIRQLFRTLGLQITYFRENLDQQFSVTTSTRLLKHYQCLFIRNRRYQHAIQASANQNNMSLRKFQWNVFGQNFLQYCRNNTKVS